MPSWNDSKRFFSHRRQYQDEYNPTYDYRSGQHHRAPPSRHHQRRDDKPVDQGRLGRYFSGPEIAARQGRDEHGRLFEQNNHRPRTAPVDSRREPNGYGPGGGRSPQPNIQQRERQQYSSRQARYEPRDDPLRRPRTERRGQDYYMFGALPPGDPRSGSRNGDQRAPRTVRTPAARPSPAPPRDDLRYGTSVGRRVPRRDEYMPRGRSPQRDTGQGPGTGGHRSTQDYHRSGARPQKDLRYGTTVRFRRR